LNNGLSYISEKIILSSTSNLSIPVTKTYISSDTGTPFRFASYFYIAGYNFANI
jgi:hypothetical protein